MKPGDRVYIQWEPDDIVYDVTYVKTERGFLVFCDSNQDMIVARKDSLSRCEVQNGNEQRNLRETPETILSGTL